MTVPVPSSSERVRGVRGRWDLETRDAMEDGPHTIAWGEFVEGKVPVVPCDGDAVERLARHLSRDVGVGFIWTADGSVWPGAQRQCEKYREQARIYLRVAGGRQ